MEGGDCFEQDLEVSPQPLTHFSTYIPARQELVPYLTIIQQQIIYHKGVSEFAAAQSIAGLRCTSIDSQILIKWLWPYLYSL